MEVIFCIIGRKKYLYLDIFPASCRIHRKEYWVSWIGSADYLSYAIFLYWRFSHHRPKRKRVYWRRPFECQEGNYFSEEVHNWNIPRNIWQFLLHTQFSPSWPYRRSVENSWNHYYTGCFPVKNYNLYMRRLNIETTIWHSTRKDETLKKDIHTLPQFYRIP